MTTLPLSPVLVLPVLCVLSACVNCGDTGTAPSKATVAPAQVDAAVITSSKSEPVPGTVTREMGGDVSIGMLGFNRVSATITVPARHHLLISIIHGREGAIDRDLSVVGRRSQLEDGEASVDLLLYDPKVLVPDAPDKVKVVVGMGGSTTRHWIDVPAEVTGRSVGYSDSDEPMTIGEPERLFGGDLTYMKETGEGRRESTTFHTVQVYAEIVPLEPDFDDEDVSPVSMTFLQLDDDHLRRLGYRID